MESIAAFFGVPVHALEWGHPAAQPQAFHTACTTQGWHMLAAEAHLGPGDALPHLGTPQHPSLLDVPGALALAQAHGKGVKLHLHGSACVQATLALLPRHVATPLVLHAELFDLLSPNATLTPDQFFQSAARACPSAVLSLGWRLPHTQDADGRLESALLDQLAALLTGPQLAHLGQAYGVEFRSGNRWQAERGGALLLDPLDHAPQPASQAPALAANVVSLARYRRAA